MLGGYLGLNVSKKQQNLDLSDHAYLFNLSPQPIVKKEQTDCSVEDTLKSNAIIELTNSTCESKTL